MENLAAFELVSIRVIERFCGKDGINTSYLTLTF